MTDGEINHLSLLLGNLQADVAAVKDLVRDGNEARRGLHTKVNSVIETQMVISARLEGLGTDSALTRAKVAAHEVVLNRGAGVLWAIGLSGGGIGAVMAVAWDKIKGGF
ncbi:MAG: hypothetical protein K9H25_23730 [Rhodospirillum sp.]|nr:hypothetical protein [Rhodospirillum sp.]MCF8492137.1 hypothetical protein [Rhodospirillum sp.]MCF8501054.1 hypothetical protein [Rhodospirillum sp.]